jgi:hypothetical protein
MPSSFTSFRKAPGVKGLQPPGVGHAPLVEEVHVLVGQKLQGEPRRVLKDLVPHPEGTGQSVEGQDLVVAVLDELQHFLPPNPGRVPSGEDPVHQGLLGAEELLGRLEDLLHEGFAEELRPFLPQEAEKLHPK